MPRASGVGEVDDAATEQQHLRGRARYLGCDIEGAHPIGSERARFSGSRKQRRIVTFKGEIQGAAESEVNCGVIELAGGTIDRIFDRIGSEARRSRVGEVTAGTRRRDGDVKTCGPVGVADLHIQSVLPFHKSHRCAHHAKGTHVWRAMLERVGDGR